MEDECKYVFLSPVGQKIIEFNYRLNFIKNIKFLIGVDIFI
jgi:hypothetical protein